MGFDDTKERVYKEKRPLNEMTLHDIEQELAQHAQNCKFEGAGEGRVEKNYRYLAFWAAMPMSEYQERKARARTEKKDWLVVVGAYTPEGAIRMPVNDSNYPLYPTLDDIIKLQEERIARHAYAKEMELKEFDTQALSHRLSTA